MPDPRPPRPPARWSPPLPAPEARHPPGSPWTGSTGAGRPDTSSPTSPTAATFEAFSCHPPWRRCCRGCRSGRTSGGRPRTAAAAAAAPYPCARGVGRQGTHAPLPTAGLATATRSPPPTRAKPRVLPASSPQPPREGAGLLRPAGGGAGGRRGGPSRGGRAPELQLRAAAPRTRTGARGGPRVSGGGEPDRAPGRQQEGGTPGGGTRRGCRGVRPGPASAPSHRSLSSQTSSPRRERAEEGEHTRLPKPPPTGRAPAAPAGREAAGGPRAGLASLCHARGHPHHPRPQGLPGARPRVT